MVRNKEKPVAQEMSREIHLSKMEKSSRNTSKTSVKLQTLHHAHKNHQTQRCSCAHTQFILVTQYLIFFLKYHSIFMSTICRKFENFLLKAVKLLLLIKI